MWKNPQIVSTYFYFKILISGNRVDPLYNVMGSYFTKEYAWKSSKNLLDTIYPEKQFKIV